MQLKELKGEIDALAKVEKVLASFKNSWLKPIRFNTNKYYSFLQQLDPQTKTQLNFYLDASQQLLHQLAYAPFTKEKLSSLAHYLIELKLASFNGDQTKPKAIINKFIKDDFLNLRQLIDEANQFEFDLKQLKLIYYKVNRLLLPQLSLEHSVAFIDAPHKSHLRSLLAASEKQKKLLKILGKEFVSLVKEMKKKKKL